MKGHIAATRLFKYIVFLLALTLLPLTEAFAKPEIFLYRSPLTAAFFAQNGTDFNTLLSRWHDYLKTQYSSEYRQVTRAELLQGLPSGLLILGSAVLLDDQEREAITRYSTTGNSVLATWGTGARDGKGHWAGYGFIEKLMGIEVLSSISRKDDDWFLNLYGDSPLTWPQPAGRRFFLGKTSEPPLKVNAKNLSGLYFNWERKANAEGANGAISYTEIGQSRRVFLGFSESSWEYIAADEFFPVLDAILSWLRHRPRVFMAAWPSGYLSGHLIEMDTEDKYENAIHFAEDLEKEGYRGTFYSLTSISRKHPDLVSRLATKHEIGYHADVHIGFKGKTEEEQLRRLNSMVHQMADSAGKEITASITGFRAPTESYDNVTDRLLRQIGIKHHVTDPAASESRLPFFSHAEENIPNEERLVILPRTQGDDLNYQALKIPKEKIEAMMTSEVQTLMQMGALGVLSVHSQNYGFNGLMDKATPPYLKQLSNNKAHAWVATGGEIAAWWRARDRVTVKSTTTLNSHTLHVSVRPPGNVKGATLMVINPSKEHPLKDLKPTQGTPSSYRIQRIDDFRTAVIFDSLATGEYQFELQF